MCVHSILTLAKVLNQRELVRNVQDEKYLANLINKFIKRVDFNRDLEQTLNLFAEVRSKFGNIGDIQENIVNRAIDLISRALQYSKGKINKKLT